MAVYFITGTLGCGKTLCTVGKIRDYLGQGRRVATNLDINLNALCKTDSKISITRVPDKPKLSDLTALGTGCEEANESRYGLLVLDELGTWFNSRNWHDKGRLEVIDWFLHARKLHWDIYFIVQSMDSLDGQLVQALCEHLVICKRTDRLTLPFIGPLLKTLGCDKVLPKIHVASVYYGQTDTAMKVDRWWYRAHDLYPAYNTDQIFDDESHAIHSVLPAYYLNNVALIDHHQAQIKKLTKIDVRPKPLPASYKTMASVFVCLLIVLISWRTYAKYNDYHAPKLEAVTTLSQPLQTTPQAPIMPVRLQETQAAPVPVADDYIKTATQNKTVTVSSYFMADGRINAFLHVEKDGDGLDTAFTLDDARALGYVVIIHGNIIEVRRNGYYFTFRTQTDLSQF